MIRSGGVLGLLRAIVFSRVGAFAATMLLSILAGGCATDPNNPDPYENTNRFFYGFNDTLDKHVMKPVADGYVAITPKPVRTGLTNAFTNLAYPDTIINGFLQGNVDQGLSDLGRMAVNSTIGIAGIFDVATGWGMPLHKADFGQTLGKWGAKPGPYLVLPLAGPSTGRDAPGIAFTVVTNPMFWIDAPFAVNASVSGVGLVNRRANASDLIRFRDEAAVEPYIFTRNAYLKYREGLIHGEKATTQQLGNLDEFEDSAVPAGSATTQPTTQPIKK